MTIIKWQGPGWYAEGDFGGRFVSYFISSHRDEYPSVLDRAARSYGIGTPKWVETPAGYDVVEETTHV